VPWLFSYGTLQQANVQLATFGRLLEGEPDSLVGFRLTSFEITDPEVIRTSGKTHHPMARFSGLASERIPGTVFEVTREEVEQADRYETDPAYQRFATRLLSGKEAWVYCDARFKPDLRTT
jgi:hypothetical protein